MMTTWKTVGLGVSLGMVLGLASADDGLTRAQVRAELLQAQRDGRAGFIGEGQLNSANLFPMLKPGVAGSGSLTRAMVRAELAEAQRTGNIMDDRLGQRLFEVSPQSYPRPPVGASKTRAQVRAELAEARLLGDLSAGGDEVQTMAEVNPARYAAVRARHAQQLEARRLAGRPTTVP